MFNIKRLKPSTYPGVPLHLKAFSRVATTGKYAEELESCNLSRMKNLLGMSRQLSLYTVLQNTKNHRKLFNIRKYNSSYDQIKGEKNIPYDQFKVQRNI